jgi:hypothetical protein
MLSTPIASIRKGITSALIIVNDIFKYETIPNELISAAVTIKIPPEPNKNVEYILEGN